MLEGCGEGGPKGVLATRRASEEWAPGGYRFRSSVRWELAGRPASAVRSLVSGRRRLPQRHPLLTRGLFAMESRAATCAATTNHVFFENSETFLGWAVKVGNVRMGQYGLPFPFDPSVAHSRCIQAILASVFIHFFTLFSSQ